MRSNLAGKELDDKVRIWLDNQAAQIRYVQDELELPATIRGSAQKFRADFLVLSPKPIAILTVVSTSSTAARMRNKRILAQRILLAERFGNQLPVLVVVPDGSSTEPYSFADKTLRVSELLSLCTLIPQITLNNEVQQLLVKGDPGGTKFSSEHRIASYWQNALTLADLADDKNIFPPGTLAHRLQMVLAPIKNSFPVDSGSTNMYGRGFVPWYLNRQWSDAFDTVIKPYIEEKCAGCVSTVKQRNSLMTGSTDSRVWKGPDGITAVIRTQSANPKFLYWRKDALIVDAWLTRAFLKPKPDYQLLLLSEPGLEAEEHRFIGGSRWERQPISVPHIRTISALEGSGWTVAPWDFACETPYFIKVLKKEAYD